MTGPPEQGHPSRPLSDAPVALQRADRFVGRTMNWMYDQLRLVPRHRPVVMTNVIENRNEFPEVEAFAVPWQRLGNRIWHRLAGDRAYPPDVRRARSYRPVVLHAHFGYVGVGALPLQRALGIPLVVAFHGADVYMLGRETSWRERYGRLFERARLVLVLGPVMAQALRELGCPGHKLVVQALGADPQQVPHAERRLERGKPLEVLFAGTMREKKGLIYLVEALGLLRQRGVAFRLHMVSDVAGRPGDDETRAEVEAALARLDLRERVERFSFLEFRQLMALALRCHVFVAPSVTARDGDSEGVPVVVQQMMLSGMPVVTTRHSDIPSLFGPLAHRLVAERDPVALADRLQEYVEQPDLLTTEGVAMRHRVLDAFDSRAWSARLSDVYDRAVAGG